MEQLKNKVAVVTGASAGIGACIVKDLLAIDMVVIGLARRAERIIEACNSLPKAQKDRLHAIRCDITKEGDVKEAFAEIEKKFGPVDVLVSNAGLLHDGYQLSTMDCAKAFEVIQTNIMGTIHSTRYAFGDSLKQKSGSEEPRKGHVVIINSVFGKKVCMIPNSVPPYNAYPPSKFALTAAADVYRKEFRALGAHIKVTNICPGATETDLLHEDYQLLNIKFLQPKDISRAVIFAVTSPPYVAIEEIVFSSVEDLLQ